MVFEKTICGRTLLSRNNAKLDHMIGINFFCFRHTDVHMYECTVHTHVRASEGKEFCEKKFCYDKGTRLYKIIKTTRMHGFVIDFNLFQHIVLIYEYTFRILQLKYSSTNFVKSNYRSFILLYRYRVPVRYI